MARRQPPAGPDRGRVRPRRDPRRRQRDADLRDRARAQARRAARLVRAWPSRCARWCPCACSRRTRLRAATGWSPARRRLGARPARCTRADDASVEDALQRILGGCVRHWIDNEAATRRRARPGRAAPAAGGPAPAALGAQPVQDALGQQARADWSDELRWLLGPLGPARDLDVFATETVPPSAGRAPRRLRRSRSCSSWWLTRAGGRTTPSATTLASRALWRSRLRPRLLGGMARLAPGGRHRRAAGAASAGTRLRRRHPDPAPSAGAQARPRFRRAQRRRHRHELRIALKKLRYGTEFFASLFPGREADRFRAAAARMQDLLGTERCGRGAACARGSARRHRARAPATIGGTGRRPGDRLVRPPVAGARAAGGRRPGRNSGRRRRSGASRRAARREAGADAAGAGHQHQGRLRQDHDRHQPRRRLLPPAVSRPAWPRSTGSGRAWPGSSCATATAGRSPALDWRKEVGDTPPELRRLVIDAPANLRMRHVDDLIGEADLVVVPVLASVFDEGSTERFLAKLDELKPIRKGRKTVALVANRLRPRSKATQRLETFLRAARAADRRPAQRPRHLWRARRAGPEHLRHRRPSGPARYARSGGHF